MKFKDMYVGQKVKVRKWEDMASDPDSKLIDDGRVIISADPNEFAMFFSDDKFLCGEIVTVRLLRDMTDGDNRTGYVFIDEIDGLMSRAWAGWMFEPVDIRVKVEADVFLKCLML